MTPDQNKLLDDIDDTQPLLEDKDFYSELVGEGKKYKDNQSLSRAAVEKDWHISRIQRENAELRQRIASQSKLEEFIDRMNNQPNTQTSTGQTGQESNTNNTAITTAEDIEKILDRREQSANRQRNLKEVRDTLQNKLGPNYSHKVRAIAEDLGYTEADMENMASQNPKVFYKVVGIDSRTADPFTPPVRSSTTVGFKPSVSSNKNYAYYENIRKQQPDKVLPTNLYFEMERAALEQGEDFFKS